jgi:hypothetical protein
MCAKKGTLGGDRTHDHKIKSLALYHLSYEGNSYGKQKGGESGFRSRCLALAKRALYRLS